MCNLIKYLQLKYHVVLILDDNIVLYNYESRSFGIVCTTSSGSRTLLKWINVNNEVIINIIDRAKREAAFHITAINDDEYESPYDVNNNDEIVIYKGIISIDMDKLINDMNDEPCNLLYASFKQNFSDNQ